MSTAVIRQPKACLLHALALAALLLTYQQLQLSPYVAMPAVLMLALWPWLGPWQRRAEDDATASASAEHFSELSRSLSQHTCHNALSAAQVAHAVQQLADKLQSQLSAIEQIGEGADAITDTEQDSAQRAEQTLETQVRLAVQQVNQSRAELELLDRVRDLAEERYRIARESYVLGAVPLTELTLAQQARDQRLRQYLAGLENVFTAEARLRVLTLASNEF